MLDEENSVLDTSVWTPDWRSMPNEDVERIVAASNEVLFWNQTLARTDQNAVSELLRGVDTLEHEKPYPQDGVTDKETGSHYYFHRHREHPQEYGHFHVYFERQRIPRKIKGRSKATRGNHTDPWRTDCHLIAISMARGGRPIELFTINHWSAQEARYHPEQIMEMVDAYSIEHADPSWPTNRWVSAILHLFRPQIHEALGRREQALTEWSDRYKRIRAADDERLEVTSVVPIDVENHVTAARNELERRQAQT